MAQILVVDDSIAVLDEVAGFLRTNGFTVDTATDGKYGLEKVEADPEIKLILADVNMPRMDGITMVEKIRNDLGNQSVVVFVLTTENDPVLKQRGKAVGVKGWIVKPFNGPGTLKAINRIVNG